MSNLCGKVAIITGASRGIGEAIAIELTKCGANVIINYSKDEQGAADTLEKVSSIAGFGKVFKADVSNYEEAKKLVEFTIKTFGKIDILVNNAGISKIGLFMDMTEQDWDKIIDVNLKSVFNCSHNVIGHMLSNQKGIIINISSIWGNVGGACESLYSASKGGINSFTKALAKELGPNNIRVNAISPGVIETNMNKCFSMEELEELKNEIPVMEFGKPEDIGKAVAFLSSEDAKYITGQVITIDGGMY